PRCSAVQPPCRRSARRCSPTSKSTATGTAASNPDSGPSGRRPEQDRHAGGAPALICWVNLSSSSTWWISVICPDQVRPRGAPRRRRGNLNGLGYKPETRALSRSDSGGPVGAVALEVVVGEAESSQAVL